MAADGRLRVSPIVPACRPHKYQKRPTRGAKETTICGLLRACLPSTKPHGAIPMMGTLAFVAAFASPTYLAMPTSMPVIVIHASVSQGFSLV